MLLYFFTEHPASFLLWGSKVDALLVPDGKEGWTDNLHGQIYGNCVTDKSLEHKVKDQQFKFNFKVAVFRPKFSIKWKSGETVQRITRMGV